MSISGREAVPSGSIGGLMQTMAKKKKILNTSRKLDNFIVDIWRIFFPEVGLSEFIFPGGRPLISFSWRRAFDFFYLISSTFLDYRHNILMYCIVYCAIQCFQCRMMQ